MTDLRQLVDDYAAAKWWHDGVGETTTEEYAPKAFAALRAILGDCDFLDTCIADYKGYEIAALIRGSITAALRDCGDST